jgi:hypothetical protein
MKVRESKFERRFLSDVSTKINITWQFTSRNKRRIKSPSNCSSVYSEKVLGTPIPSNIEPNFETLGQSQSSLCGVSHRCDSLKNSLAEMDLVCVRVLPSTMRLSYRVPATEVIFQKTLRIQTFRNHLNQNHLK